jgi:hypothetical protein
MKINLIYLDFNWRYMMFFFISSDFCSSGQKSPEFPEFKMSVGFVRPAIFYPESIINEDNYFSRYYPGAYLYNSRLV